MKTAFLAPSLTVPLTLQQFTPQYLKQANNPLQTIPTKRQEWNQVNRRIRLEKTASYSFDNLTRARSGPERLKWALIDTEKFIASSRFTTAQNPSFFIDLSKQDQRSFGLYAKPFILEKLDQNQFHMAEVLLDTEPREKDLLTLSFQYYILKESGIDVSQVSLLRQSVKEFIGDKTRFEPIDVTAEVKSRQDYVEKHITQIRQLIDETPPPLIGNSKLTDMEYPVSALLNSKYKYWMTDRLVALGYTDIRHIPKNFRGLRSIHKRQIDAHKQNAPYFDLNIIQRKFKERVWPAHYLDFETRIHFKDQPHELQIPHQYSNHIVAKDGSLVQQDTFLPNQHGDPRLNFAISLAKTLSSFGNKGTIVVYHERFEKSRIQELITYCKDKGEDSLAEQLQSFLPRIEDQLYLLRDAVYHKDFRGSYSLKATHPALVSKPKYDYKQMNIQQGLQAAAAIERLMTLYDQLSTFSDNTESLSSSKDSVLKEILQIKKDLTLYCSADTWNEVEVDQALMSQLRLAGIEW